MMHQAVPHATVMAKVFFRINLASPQLGKAFRYRQRIIQYAKRIDVAVKLMVSSFLPTFSAKHDPHNIRQSEWRISSSPLCSPTFVLNSIGKMSIKVLFSRKSKYIMIFYLILYG